MFVLVGETRAPGRKPTQTKGEHVKFTQKGPSSATGIKPRTLAGLLTTLLTLCCSDSAAFLPQGPLHLAASLKLKIWTSATEIVILGMFVLVVPDLIHVTVTEAGTCSVSCGKLQWQEKLFAISCLSAYTGYD